MFLTAFRIGLNVADSNVIDVGYAGVIGADRIADGHELYGDGFSADVERGDTYGPVNYLLYVPFEQALPWSGRWDDLPAAHGAAIAFDLLALGGLLLLGRRLRPGREGTALGVALGYAWVAYPYTAFVLESNSNDTLVAVACVGALLAATLARERASAAAAGVGVAPGRGREVRDRRAGAAVRAPLAASSSSAALLLVLALAVAPFIPDGGLRELYDRTIGYQASRPSPFSIWGQVDSLGWLQDVAKGPRRPGSRSRRHSPARARPPPDRRARRRDPDRGGADRDALVLPLHRLVRAVRVRRAVGGARHDAAGATRAARGEREAVFA